VLISAGFSTGLPSKVFYLGQRGKDLDARADYQQGMNIAMPLFITLRAAKAVARVSICSLEY